MLAVGDHPLVPSAEQRVPFCKLANPSLRPSGLAPFPVDRVWRSVLVWA